MTTSHKVVLSLIAVVCITLIVFYSVKGNQQAGPRTVPAANTGAGQPEVAKAKTPVGETQTAFVPPRANGKQAGGLDEIVSRVRSEVASQDQDAGTKGASADTITSTSPAKATSNAAVSTDAPVVKLTEANAAPTTTSSDAKTSTSTDTATAPAANAAASVPSITIGDAPKTADGAPGKSASSLLEGDLADIADLPIKRDPLPPLANVTDDRPAEKTEPVKTETTTEATPAKEPATNTTTTDTKEASAPAIDPHKPAAKVETPDTSVASAIKPVTTSETTKPAANVIATSPATTPAKTPASTVPPIPGQRYTIQAGDTFSSIATKIYGAEKHWIDIADANPTIDPKKVRIGQVITLPDIDKDEPKATDVKTTTTKTDTLPKVDAKTDSKSQPKADAKTATLAADVKFHEVKAGENLTSISRRYFNTPDHWRHIYLTNRELIGGDPGKLHAGTKLKITTPKTDAKND